MLNFNKIKQECPKSWELLRKWTGEKVQEMKAKIMQGAPISKEENVFPEINDVLIEATLSWQIRVLFTFFDLNKIEIEIYKGWKYYITHEPDEEFNSRVEAEIAAFEAAFYILEDRI